MSFDVVVVGGGTAGCVLAGRLSENPDRSVCLVEAGPDYGPLDGGRWPPELLDAKTMPETHRWPPGGEDERSLGGRVLGGSSAVNACMIVEGSPADYDEWGDEWSYEQVRRFFARAKAELRTARTNTDDPAPFHRAFLAAAQAIGFALLEDASDPSTPVGAAEFPANVVDGSRWNAAFAYLDPARTRPNLSVEGDTLVDRVLVDGGRATGVVTTEGRSIAAETVVLAAGAYFTPAILQRSGIGPAGDLERLGIAVVSDLPIGARLLDHCGTSVVWQPSARLQDETERHARETALFHPHVVVKAASSACARDSWDLHLVSWIAPGTEGVYEPTAIVFHMKPASTGRVRLRSRDPLQAPLVERGFLSREEDLAPLLEGIELARALGAAEPLAELVAGELEPDGRDLERYVRETIRNYFHPAGTCPLGEVTDFEGRVLGVAGLVVADASLMPTIPRANTNLTTAAIAERIAESLR